MYDPNLHLFLDDREIHQLINVQRVLNRPAKLPEPVVVADQPWESGCEVGAWGSVIREKDGLFRLWSMLADPKARDNCYCYAESRDGIHWEKPVLGLVEWRGNKQNNAFYRFEKGTPPGVLNNMDGLTVVRDDDEPDPDKRYKLIANMQDGHMWARAHPDRWDYHVPDEEIEAARKMFGQYMLTSPDGVHWTQKPQFLKPAYRDYMMVTRDYRNQQWWMNESPPRYANVDSGHRSRRDIGLSTSKDMINWSPTEIVFLNGPDSDFGRLWEWHGMTPFNYGNMDLGFLETQTSVYAILGIELTSHRDGEPWQRVAPDQYILEGGPEGSYDRFGATPLHNYPIPAGDKLHIYYNCTSYAPGYREGDLRKRVIALATIGLDRFVALGHGHEKTREPTGIVVTKPVEVAGNALQVNVETYGGEVRVAVKNAPDLSDIPGFGLEECVPVEDNEVRAKVGWKEKADLSELRGREVMLIFNVRRALLYSYRFTTL